MDSDTPSTLSEFPVVLRLPIEWGDLDAYAHVNNLVYLKWFEAARAEYGMRVGVEVISRTEGIGAVVHSISGKYHRQMTYPGEVFVGVRVTRISLGSVALECRIADGATGVLVAESECDVVLFDYAAAKPVAVPDHIRHNVERLEGKPFPL